MLIQTLIDKQDTFEIVRDQIGAILFLNFAEQQALAPAAGKDPDDWKVDVFVEASNPFEKALNNEQERKFPTVNVWYRSGAFDHAKGNSERQTHGGSFHIDCYGFGISEATAEGHTSGDKTAALESQRCARLVRNILMASVNTNLDLPDGVVGDVWVNSINSFQPRLGQQPVVGVMGSQISFHVNFNEFSPQFESEILELLSIDIHRQIDGKLVAEADFNYAP